MAEVEAGVVALHVALEGHVGAVARVLEEGVVTGGREGGGGEDNEVGVVAGLGDDLLAPVAENVAVERDGVAPGVAGAGEVVAGEEAGGAAGGGGAVPLVDELAVERFAQDVGVPPDAEVAVGGLGVADGVAELVDEGPAGGGPALLAGEAGVDGADVAAAVVDHAGGVFAPDHLAAQGVVEDVVELGGVVLLDGEAFEAGAVGVDVGDVEAVAVVELVDEEGGAVVVDRHGDVADLVAAVAVEVADAEAVAVRVGAGGRVELPARGEDEGAGSDVVGVVVVGLVHVDERRADAVEEGDAHVLGVGGRGDGGGDLRA